MKYTIRFSCGHTEIRNLKGSKSECESLVEYFKEKGICKRCYKNKLSFEEQIKQAGSEENIPQIIRGKYWNKKFYGQDNDIIYVDNTMIKLTKKQVNELYKYLGFDLKKFEIAIKKKKNK